MFTIRVRAGATTITPYVAMLARASAWWHSKEENPDERFLRSEAYATFWAAASLSTGPVINRPAKDGFIGRMTWSALGVALSSHSTTCDGEFHASGPECFTDVDETIWGEDCEFHVAPIGDLRLSVPIRARRINLRALYEIVTIVGDRAFTAAAISRSSVLQLKEKSINIARSLGLHFATVTWAIDKGGAVPVRLNGTPDESELLFVLDAMSLRHSARIWQYDSSYRTRC